MLVRFETSVKTFHFFLFFFLSPLQVKNGKIETVTFLQRDGSIFEMIRAVLFTTGSYQIFIDYV